MTAAIPVPECMPPRWYSFAIILRNLRGKLLGVLPNDQKRKLMTCSFRMRTVTVMFAATGVDSFVGESNVPG